MMTGAIRWFARNGVAANLLMFLIAALGLNAIFNRIPLEVFPEFELDIVRVTVPYRGATPAEVEEGVVVRIEEALFDLEGIEELRSESTEGAGVVTVEVATGYDPRELLNDIKNRVDAISTFPEEIERPVISLAQTRREVISVVVSGDLAERELRQLGERVRDDIADLRGVTQVELTGVRPYEIAIEVAEDTLQKYGLTFERIASAINDASLDLSAGAIRTQGGEILIRSKGQAYVKEDFDKIVVVKRNDGTRLTIGDIAEVKDGFEEEPLMATFNGRRAVVIEVYRTGDQSAIDVATAVKQYAQTAATRMPSGVELTVWRDRARIVKARLGTLTTSAIQGGILIFLLLTLFLRFSVAIWVCIGIPISFMGALALMPELGVTINIISLFAFILVLGIVVDDAIVTGENIYKHLQREANATQASINGTLEIATPVIFGVLTTVVAFIPLLMVEGERGQIFAQIPKIVIPVLLFSLVESKLILPAHLKHLRVYGDENQWHNPLVRVQRKVARSLEWAIARLYQPLLAAALRQRYFTLSIFVGVAVIVLTLVFSGWISFIFFPRVQSETARANLIMATGTPFSVTSAHIDRMNVAAQRLRDQYVDPETGESVIKNILATYGSLGSGDQGGQSHLGRVMFEIVAPEERTLDITSSDLVREWRQAIGPIPGAREITYRAEIGRGGDPLDVQLMAEDFDRLRAVAQSIKTRLSEYPGVFDIADTLEEGKQEIQLNIKPAAEQLGLSMADLARQVRRGFFGLEAQRIQRGREDVRVMVRYPEKERQSLADLESMRIRTSAGVEVPFTEVATATSGKSYSAIKRINRNRTINVTADVDKESANLEAVKSDLTKYLQDMLAEYPDVRFSLEGEAREQQQSFRSLLIGAFFVLFAIYALLAIPFRSYVQPVIVMSIIPFGIVGAVLGHLTVGMYLSISSVMGMLALVGVVVNDSLVLVDYVNRRRRAGMALFEAVATAGTVRFRPVFLTSLTTFAGLMPLIFFEKTTQAQFLIPMAVSLGFGILFATFVTLLLIPINYLILEDIRRLFGRGEEPIVAPV